MRDSFLVFGKPVLHEEEMAEVLSAMRAGWLGTGPKVAQFERDFAAYKRIKHVAAVNSCTAALHLACLALDLSPGDEVITTANTFCASVNAIIHAGLTPVLADIRADTLNIDPDAVERRITSRTRALLVVHFAGRPCDMDRLGAIAAKHGLFIIEDCAHAIEAEYHGRGTGTFGHLGCFSFYPTKNMTTGEGGMVISADEALMSKVKVRSLHGLSADAWKRYSDDGYKHYFVTDLGFKYNMMDLQAAIGLHQLKRLDGFWLRRQALWKRYVRELGALPLGLPPALEPDVKHAHHLFTIRVATAAAGLSRDQFLDAMKAHNIGVGVHYVAIPEHPYYRERFRWHPEEYPVATAFGRETVSLPLSPGLSDSDVDDVVAAVKAVLASPT